MRNLFEASNGIVSFGSSYVAHDPVDLECPDDGRTQQEFAEECDINALMARYQKTGVMPSGDASKAFYGDFADLPDYMQAQEIMLQAQAAFDMLPAVVRRQFDNDPALFVAFAEKEENIEQMRSWGLAKPLDPPQAVEAPEAPPAAQDGPAPA